jgi:Ca2+-binding RTX toxin-like protein
MAIPSGNSVPLTGFSLFDGLAQGSKWVFSGAPILTYSIWDSFGYVWYPEGIEAIYKAFNSYSQYINVTFQYKAATGTATNNNSDLSLLLASEFGADAIAGFPDPVAMNLILASVGLSRADYPTVEGDIIFDPTVPELQYLGDGQEGFFVGLHELGHSLGLKHPHDDGANGRPTFTSLGIAGLDNVEFTVMSYNNPAVSDLSYGFPATPMVLDVYALQQIYGANPYTGLGDTRYVLSEEARAPLRTIWDVGGFDHIDGSAMARSLTIDLSEGGYNGPITRSSTGNGLYVAIGAVIEAATGGSHDDDLWGNTGDNRLRGGGGNDFLYGGAGADQLDGGIGFDSVSYQAAAVGVTINLALGIGASGEAQGDTYIDIEDAIGSDFDDVFVGIAGTANTLIGRAGNDIFYGEGLDSFDAGAGIDVLFGGQGGALSLNLGSSGLETVWGSVAGDILNGSTATANLVMIGQGGADTMTGGSGNDFLYFDSADTINGGGGNDWAVVFAGIGPVSLNLSVTNIENAWGSTGDDVLSAAASAVSVVVVGDAGNDTVTGGSAGDFIYGFSGNDLIDGRGGNDNLGGGSGTDTFVFSAGWGQDIVWDWTDLAGPDQQAERFDMRPAGLTFAQLVIDQNFLGSGNALIASGPNQILVIGGAGRIDAGDFIF